MSMRFDQNINGKMRGTEIRKDTISGEKDSESRDWRCQATCHRAGSLAKPGHISMQPNTGKQRFFMLPWAPGPQILARAPAEELAVTLEADRESSAQL